MMIGLGAEISASGNISYPSYCSWLPFSSFTDACKLPTPDQILSSDLSNLGPAASPESVAMVKQRWAETYAAECQAHPDDCKAYDFAIANPNISAAIGTGSGAPTTGDLINSAGDALTTLANAASFSLSSPLIVLAGAGLIIYFVTKGRR